MLVKYREELTRPLQEAMDFLRRVESQLSSLTHGATASIFSNAGKLISNSPLLSSVTRVFFFFLILFSLSFYSATVYIHFYEETP